MIDEKKSALQTVAAIDMLHPANLLQTFLACSRAERRERFLDTGTAARMTGLSRRTIQWWIESGLVDAIRIGRRYQIDRSSLIAHLSSSCEP